MCTKFLKKSKRKKNTYSALLTFLGQSLGCSPGNSWGWSCNEWGKKIWITWKNKRKKNNQPLGQFSQVERTIKYIVIHRHEVLWEAC